MIFILESPSVVDLVACEPELLCWLFGQVA